MNKYLKKSDLKHGDYISCVVDYKDVSEALVVIEKNVTYLLQNIQPGSQPPSGDLRGYKYSWSLGTNNSASTFGVDKMQIVEHTIEHLHNGDRVCNRNGTEYVVVEILGSLVFYRLPDENTILCKEKSFLRKNKYTLSTKKVQIPAYTKKELVELIGHDFLIKD